MNLFGERWLSRNADYYADPDASPHALLSDATEWLQYARHTTALLAELIDDAEELDTPRLSIALEGIKAMTDVGLRCAVLAQARWQWIEMREAMAPGAGATPSSETPQGVGP